MEERQNPPPVKYAYFNDDRVKVFIVEKQNYITGEDLGKCLGFSDPQAAVRKLFSRNRDELAPHSLRVKLTRKPTSGHGQKNSGGNQTPMTRLYSEVGCYLVSMFAKTPKAKEVRLWLASLPGVLRGQQAKYRLLREESDLERLAVERGYDPDVVNDPQALKEAIVAKTGKRYQLRQYYKRRIAETGTVPYGMFLPEGRKASGRRPKQQVEAAI